MWFSAPLDGVGWICGQTPIHHRFLHPPPSFGLVVLQVYVDNVGNITSIATIMLQEPRLLIEGSLEVKLPTIWTDEKQRWEESVKRREEERRSKKRKSQKKEDPGARKGRKVPKHCVFPMICGSGGSKSRLAKAAGAEPAVQMRDEKLHAVVRFAETILRDRCSTSYDPVSLFRCRRSSLDRWCWKIAKRNGTRPSALHSTFHVWRTSGRIASFLVLSTKKNGEVSQNCFVFGVVKCKNWGSLAELLRFWCCQVQKLRTSRRIASFSSLQIDR